MPVVFKRASHVHTPPWRLASGAALLAGLLLPTHALAAPDAIDDSFTTESNTSLIGADLAANDASVGTDTYTLTTAPSNGTATVSASGLLDYTPNVGFASVDTLTYTVDDGAGGVDTASVSIDVTLTSDYLTSASAFLIGQEDVPTPLNLSVDPSLEFGGTLQDIIGVAGLFRASNAGSTPAAASIPAGSNSVLITGYGTRDIGTVQGDDVNDDYQMLTTRVNLLNGTHSGRLTYSVRPANGNIDQFSWVDVPLGESVLSDLSRVSGDWTGASDPVVSISGGQIQIAETIPLQMGYHVEFMTANGDSANFISGGGAVQAVGVTQSTIEIPTELEPSGTKNGYIVLTSNSATSGSNSAVEHKGLTRLVIDLEAGSVSGVIASERGETDNNVVTWAFTDYPLVDLRDTPAGSPLAIKSSTATMIGDTTATSTGTDDNPTLHIDTAGDLIVQRSASHASIFTTMFTAEFYERTELSSIASFVGVQSDTTLFDDRPADGVDANGKPINIQTFEIPASASVGLVQMSWQTIGGSDTNENVGLGFAVIDLEGNSSSGSIAFMRATTPDLLAWQTVPLGTTMFGATDGGGNDLYQSNKNAGGFTDDYAENATFTLINNADGSRTLEFTASSDNGTQTFRDYQGDAQVAWLGSEPFNIQGVPIAGYLSHGSPLGNGDWEVDLADIEDLALSTDPHVSGEILIDLVLESTGETESLVVHVEPVVDPAAVAGEDASGYVDTPLPLDLATTDSVDVDGSETQVQTLTLSGLPATVALSASAGTVSDLGGGSWDVDLAALPALSASSTAAGSTLVTVSGTNTDTNDLDGDLVIEDGDNGAGADELDTVTYQDTFTLIFNDLPTVDAQVSATDTPVISGTASPGPAETLTVTVNGVIYTQGDGNLVVNPDGTWDLTIPPGDALPDGNYSVTATLTHADGSVGSDVTTSELDIDTTPPVAPVVTPQNTSNTSPLISGTATVAAGETLTVEVDGVVYTAGDGNLVDNGDGTWELTPSSPLADGTYAVTATVTDAAGNVTSDASAGELVIDTTAPVTPTVATQNTNDTTPVISGTATIASGETLTVTVDGVTYTAGDGNLVDNGDGTWDLTVPTPLAEGSYNVIATVTDAAGNVSSDASAGELVIDTTDPVTPSVTPQNTSDTTPVISGTATVAPGETLTVEVDGVVYTAGDGNLVDNGDGTWDLTLPTPLAEGNYEVVATVTDEAGNATSDINLGELVIDTTDPVTPTVAPQTTSDTTPVISGTATVAPGETLTVIIDGVTYTAGDGNLVDNGDGTWDLTLPTPLAEGSYDVIATVTDAAGNVSSDASAGELVIDTTNPATPSVTAQSTSNTTPVISGTANVAPGETLTVEVDGVVYTAGDGNLVDNGDGTWDLTIPTPLAEGNYEVVATVTDAAGNVSSDINLGELVVDTTDPVTPTVAPQTTNNTTPVISGTATIAAGETLSVTIDGVTYTAGDGNLVDNGDGTWDLTVPTPLAEGSYDVIATVTDAAGNTASDASAGELIIDTTDPVTPTVAPQTTSNTTPVISGTATVAPGETLTVTVDGVTYTAGDGNLVDNGDGTWDLTIPTPLAEGDYEVVATVTDAAGNVTSDINLGELVIDTTDPVTPEVTAQTTNNTTPVVSGSATVAAGETLTVEVDGVVYTAGDGNLVDNGDGTWDLTIPTPLAEGSYEVIATVTDAAGNTSSDATTGELVIDTTDPVAPSVAAQNTSDTTPVISGTATVAPGETLSVEVDGVVYTAGDGNLVDNGDGTWDLTVPTPLAEGSYDVVATVTDAAGNVTSDASAGELVIDTTNPATPTVTPQNTSDTTPVISGTATVAPGETLTVEVDGVVYTAGDGNLVDNGDGTWDLTIPTPLAEGNYEVVATVTDAAGNVTTDINLGELVVDTTDPAAPEVTAQTTNNTTPIITGTATVAPGETLTVEVDGVVYTAGDGNLVDNGDGTWDLTVPTPLAEGSYDVIATVTDSAGNTTSDTTAGELVIDTTDPVAPTVAPQDTSDTTPVISGTATVAPGETLTVTVDGVTYTAGDGNLVDNGDGTWELSVPTPLAEGSYDVVATVTDTAGNVTSDASAGEVVIDTTNPATPTVTPQNTSDTTPVISGTATVAPGETLTVEVDGVVYTAGDGNLVDNGDGTWNLTIPTPLAEGNYEVIATVTDAAGNTTSDINLGELVVDTTDPAAPTVAAQNTNDTAPVISGTAVVAPGETLTVEVDGVIYTAGDGNLVDNGDGTWDLAMPTPLAEGSYDVVVTVTDAAGNTTSDSSLGELVIDTTDPVTPTVVPQTNSDTTPVISGTATVAPGETLTVEVDGVVYTAGDGNLVDNGDGTWTLSIPTPLAEGSYDVVATVTDAAGNITSDASAGELVIDTTAPTLPEVTPLVTNDASPVVSGTATVAPGETLSVTVDGVTYTEGDGNLVLNPDGTWDLNLPVALDEGSYDIVATVTDSAGNVTSDASLGELTIDLTAPLAPGVTSLTTVDTAPVISGTATVGPNETLTVEVDGVVYTAGDGNLVDNGDGTWDLTIPASDSLPEGLYQVVATVTDAAGNASTDPGVDDLLIDTTAPNAPGVTSQTTSDTTPLISGTATLAAGETLSVDVNGVTYTDGDGFLTVASDGTWTLDIPTPLPEGSVDVTATITDAAGNTSTDPSSGELLIDTTPPTAPTVDPLVTSDGTPVITGTANPGPGETLTVTVDGVTYTAGDGTLVDNGDGTWTLNLPTPLAEGNYDVIATVTDAAGNSTSDSSDSELVIDTTDPAEPTVNAQTTNSTSPVISGTADVAPGETLTVEVDGVVYTAGDGNLVDNGDGTWTLDLPVALTDGTYPVTVTVTDAAGNVSTDVSTGELVIDTMAPDAAPGVESQTTSNPTPTLSGTADLAPGDVLTVTINGVTYTAGDGNLVDNGDGTWTLDIPDALPVGEYDMTVSITDATGNTSSETFSNALTILPEGDFDGDGIPDAIDLDDDNDGIPDLTEGTRDSDGDGQPDYLDLDSDNDGIADIVEVFGEDADNDYRVDNMLDNDNNGLSDELQVLPFELVDTDGDLVPDYLDLDSDNDGITDLLESGGIDDDNNGRIDDLEDTNGDGVDDAAQLTNAPGVDTDGDGVPNRLDRDTDNDGLFDAIEAGGQADNGEGIINPMLDSDGDGIPDSVDADQTFGNDVDGDGIDDRFDASFLQDDDTDGDGIVDSADPDANGDGFADDPQNSPALGQALPDVNGNDIADVFEPGSGGALRTGLEGRGCSITGDATSKDPLFALLVASSAFCWWRRRRVPARSSH